MQRLHSLQILRAVAALMVVLFHAHAYILPAKLDSDSSYFGGFDMGYAGVELFFVISGFVMWKIHRKDFDMPGRAPRFVYKRVARIYPTYLIIFFTLLLLYLFLPDSGPENATVPSHVLWSATLFPTPFEPVLSVAWTLQFEMFFYLVFATVILTSKALFLFAIWALACVVNILVDTKVFPLSFFFSAYNLLFMIGMLTAREAPRMDAARSRSIAVAGVILYLFIGLAEAYHLVEWHKPSRTVLYGLGAAMIMGFVGSGERSSANPPGHLVLVGDASYSIYLVHMPAMLILAELLKTSGALPVVPAPLAFVSLISLAIGCGVLTYLFVEKPVLRFFRHKYDAIFHHSMAS